MNELYKAIERTAKWAVKGQSQFDFRDIAQDAMLYTLEHNIKDKTLAALKAKSRFVDMAKTEMARRADTKNNKAFFDYLYAQPWRDRPLYQGMFYQEQQVLLKELNKQIENKTMNFYERREALKRLKTEVGELYE